MLAAQAAAPRAWGGAAAAAVVAPQLVRGLRPTSEPALNVAGAPDPCGSILSTVASANELVRNHVRGYLSHRTGPAYVAPCLVNVLVPGAGIADRLLRLAVAPPSPAVIAATAMKLASGKRNKGEAQGESASPVPWVPADQDLAGHAAVASAARAFAEALALALCERLPPAVLSCVAFIPTSTDTANDGFTGGLAAGIARYVAAAPPAAGAAAAGGAAPAPGGPPAGGAAPPAGAVRHAHLTPVRAAPHGLRAKLAAAPVVVAPAAVGAAAPPPPAHPCFIVTGCGSPSVLGPLAEDVARASTIADKHRVLPGAGGGLLEALHAVRGLALGPAPGAAAQPLLDAFVASARDFPFRSFVLLEHAGLPLSYAHGVFGCVGALQRASGAGGSNERVPLPRQMHVDSVRRIGGIFAATVVGVNPGAPALVHAGAPPACDQRGGAFDGTLVSTTYTPAVAAAPAAAAAAGAGAAGAGAAGAGAAGAGAAAAGPAAAAIVAPTQDQRDCAAVVGTLLYASTYHEDVVHAGEPCYSTAARAQLQSGAHERTVITQLRIAARAWIDRRRGVTALPPALAQMQLGDGDDPQHFVKKWDAIRVYYGALKEFLAAAVANFVAPDGGVAVPVVEAAHRAAVAGATAGRGGTLRSRLKAALRAAAAPPPGADPVEVTRFNRIAGLRNTEAAKRRTKTVGREDDEREQALAGSERAAGEAHSPPRAGRGDDRRKHRLVEPHSQLRGDVGLAAGLERGQVPHDGSVHVSLRRGRVGAVDAVSNVGRDRRGLAPDRLRAALGRLSVA
jgi:hypothetical protein